MSEIHTDLIYPITSIVIKSIAVSNEVIDDIGVMYGKYKSSLFQSNICWLRTVVFTLSFYLASDTDLPNII